MGNQYSYPEAKSNQESLKGQVEGVATQMRAVQGVVSNFMNVEGFGGETEQQVKGFMSEVVLGAVEASNLLIENVDIEYRNMMNRFQGLDGADDAIIYDSRLTLASQQNDEYAQALTNKANEMNGLIQQANALGVSGRKYEVSEITAYKDRANTKIKELSEKLTAEGNKTDEADSLNRFVDSVRQFVGYLGSCQPTTYTTGAIAEQPFYMNYSQKVKLLMDQKSVEEFAKEKYETMPPFMKGYVTAKMLEAAHDENSKWLETYFNYVAANISLQYNYNPMLPADHPENIKKIEEAQAKIKDYFDDYAGIFNIASEIEGNKYWKSGKQDKEAMNKSEFAQEMMNFLISPPNIDPVKFDNRVESNRPEGSHPPIVPRDKFITFNYEKMKGLSIETYERTVEENKDYRKGSLNNYNYEDKTTHSKVFVSLDGTNANGEYADHQTAGIDPEAAKKLAQSTAMAGVALNILGRVPVISSIFSTSGNIQEVMDVKDALTGKAGNEAEKEAKDEIAKWENVKSIETAQNFDMTVTVYGNNVSVKATPKTKEIIDEINKKLEKINNKEYLSVEDLLHGDDRTREIYNMLYKTYYVEN